MLPTAESVQIVLPVVSILFLLLSFKRSIYGAISYFIVINAKLGLMYPVLGAMRYELVVAFTVFLSILVGGGKITNVLPSKNDLNRSFWVLVFVGMVSVPQAIIVSISWQNGGYTLLKLALFYIMIVAAVNDRKDLEKMIWAIVLMSAWIAYEPVVSYISGGGEQHAYGEIALGRFGVATGHVALANTLSQTLPILFYWAYLNRKRKIAAIITWSMFVLVIIGVVFSKSRGGFIGLLTVSAGIIYFSKNKRKSLLIILSLFLLLLPFAGQQYLSHMNSITDGVGGSRSSGDRLLGLLNGLSMMQKRPILGVGIGCYAEARRIYFSYYFYAHNLYGELFGELGLASVFWFYWIYSLFKRAAQLKRELQSTTTRDEMFFLLLTGIQISLVVRLVLGNFSHCAFIWFWFVMAALVVSIDNIYKKENQKYLET